MEEQRRAWQKEEEEYAYQTKMKRRKEEDTYQLEQEKRETTWSEKVAIKEKEFQERAQMLKSQEEELNTLRVRAAAFTQERDEAVHAAVNTRETELTREFEHEKRLHQQEAGAMKQMLEGKLESLKETIGAQATDIVSLKQALAEANRQTQTLASTVVESVSGAKHLQATVQTLTDKQRPAQPMGGRQ